MTISVKKFPDDRIDIVAQPKTERGPHIETFYRIPDIHDPCSSKKFVIPLTELSLRRKLWLLHILFHELRLNGMDINLVGVRNRVRDELTVMCHQTHIYTVSEVR